MGFTAHPGATHNVEGSFNDFFETQLTAKGIPAWMPSAVVNYDFPQKPLTFPSWSVTHLGAEPGQEFEGRNLDPGWKGGEQIGMVEISCWESYARAQGSHPQYLRQMRDMVARVFATGAAFAILDVYGSTAAPTGNGTIARCGRVSHAPAPPDPNPDVARVRMLVTYRWMERATAG